MGVMFHDLNRFNEALATYSEAISTFADNASLRWNRSLTLLLTGQFQDGWHDYESRTLKPDTSFQYQRFRGLQWRGQTSMKGKRLLVHAEQGLGDFIQFVRYLGMLKGLDAELILEVPSALIPLMSTYRGSVKILKQGDPIPDFDGVCPIMSLPLVFGTTIENIPQEIPYLFADPAKVQAWQLKLGAKRCMRVGIAWFGTKTHARDAIRSVPLQKFKPLLDQPIEWHVLQNEYRTEDQALLAELRPRLHQHYHILADFSDTAALISHMDLVISVDTSIAHLAGAMGKPIWVLLSFVPDFRWLLQRDDSPWYPSARLFRQDASMSWEPVIRSITLSLSAHLT